MYAAKVPVLSEILKKHWTQSEHHVEFFNVKPLGFETLIQFWIQSIKCVYIHRVSQEECARLCKSVPYVTIYRYNPKHLYPKLNGYGDNGQRSMKLWQLLHIYWLPNTY